MDNIVNKPFLRKNKEIAEQLANNKLPNNIFDEYSIPDDHHSLIVRANIYNSSKTYIVLDLLLEKYASKNEYPNSEIIVFLHKKQNFDNPDIERIKKKYSIKSYLFGDGDDFIYYERVDKGFLSHAGTFDEIENIQNKSIPKQYFDNVWEFYNIEMKSKIYDLKQDLINLLLLNDFEVEDKIEKILETKQLLFRLRDFTNYYRESINELKKEYSIYEFENKKIDYLNERDSIENHYRFLNQELKINPVLFNNLKNYLDKNFLKTDYLKTDSKTLTKELVPLFDDILKEINN